MMVNFKVGDIFILFKGKLDIVNIDEEVVNYCFILFGDNNVDE